MRRKHIILLILVAYVGFILFLTVLSRESSDKYPIRLDLFEGILEPGPEGYRDLILNIVGFIPVGVLVGLLSRRYRVVKALLAGMLISLTVECSQLIWHRGVFDVNDLFNNTLGALIGGVIAVGIVKICSKRFFISLA